MTATPSSKLLNQEVLFGCLMGTRQYHMTAEKGAQELSSRSLQDGKREWTSDIEHLCRDVGD